ncbi:AttM/AiiB family protein [Minicystis rosea]|nr:AttM/AiiB family protein [Minicystis rosea]
MPSISRAVSALGLIHLLSACAATPQSPAKAAASTTAVRLYVLDCGHIDIPNMKLFADVPEYVGARGSLAVPCFLVRHPRGNLLWDTGLNDAIAREKDGVIDAAGGHATVKATLRAQLDALGIAPDEITYVGISHLHADHAGNANLFPKSTWLLNRAELAWGSATPAPLGVDPTTFSAYRTAKVKLLDGDEDVFGDASAVVLQTPGHTPGHQSLVVRLAHAGTLVLSGDLCHTRANWEKHRVPAMNHSRERTLSSMDRVEALVVREHGRFVVQHAIEDVGSLPRFPSYLE